MNPQLSTRQLTQPVDDRSNQFQENQFQEDLITMAQLIGRKWHLVLVYQLSVHGSLGFAALAKVVDGIANKVLSESLDDLERNGFIERTIVSDTPFRVEYSLTDAGRALEPIIASTHEINFHHD